MKPMSLTSLLSICLLASPLSALAAEPVTAAAALERPSLSTATLVAHYAELVQAVYQDSYRQAQALQVAVDALIKTPSDATLAAARQAWLNAREPYGQSEAFRFYSGPIDDEADIEGRLNPWPLDEAYIDGVQGKAKSGFINNRQFKLSIESLIRQNAKGGEANIATGYHAIEFLLWGQDFNDAGPGNRRYTDFVDGKAPNAARRRQYLKLVTEQVVADLKTLVDSWAPNQANYRANFVAEPEPSLRKILTSLAVLSSAELAGERIQVALDNQDQEDEHSCFSDNTHRDLVTNAQGLENVVTGRYRRIDGSSLEGPGIAALVAASNAKLSQQLLNDFAQSVAAAEAIKAPFDQEIKGADTDPGRVRVQQLVKALQTQTLTLVSAAKVLGIQSLSVQATE